MNLQKNKETLKHNLATIKKAMISASAYQEIRKFEKELREMLEIYGKSDLSNEGDLAIKLFIKSILGEKANE